MFIVGINVTVSTQTTHTTGKKINRHWTNNNVRIYLCSPVPPAECVCVCGIVCIMDMFTFFWRHFRLCTRLEGIPCNFSYLHLTDCERYIMSISPTYSHYLHAFSGESGRAAKVGILAEHASSASSNISRIFVRVYPHLTSALYIDYSTW